MEEGFFFGPFVACKIVLYQCMGGSRGVISVWSIGELLVCEGGKLVCGGGCLFWSIRRLGGQYNG